MAISLTTILSSKDRYAEEHTTDNNRFKPSSVLNYLGLGGAIVLMGIVTSQAGFGIPDWSLFGLLAIGSIPLAYFNDKLYGFVQCSQ